ncbi:family 14 glycosylhydrolase [Priestia flexa]|uniref:family 14 glycosylhydrolase n=1 Tax=Priestia flexa TaxID=86664 RepID=UPI0024BF181B|nr:family 14 glycosylhydrolase [Priestia flexa]WHX79422.1 family 14 glycosylhydrolase [Priestia flexa]
MYNPIKKFASLIVLLSFVTALILGPTNSQAAVNGQSFNSNYKTYLMAPLKKVTEFTTWEAFENDLRKAKQNGFYAVTVDFWWGDMEKNGDQQFDFSYAQRFAQAARNAGIKMVPIISTHQCGGNVGDDCNTPLPSWIWNTKTDDSLYFKSETGTVNKETVNPLATDVITKQYGELYTAFAQALAPYKDVIPKVYLSGGPAGELRYPSYTVADGTGYPSRGKFQAYTDFAKSKFQMWAVNKYGSLAGVNQAWGLSLTSTSQILPPSDGNQFLKDGYNTNYGKDFLEWYQGVLQDHAKRIGALAHQAFDPVFNVPVGAKIAGIHWQYNNPTMPHAAEKPAGYNNYSTLLDSFKTAKLDLTFTCLEMVDSGTYPEYSMPKTLVKEVASLANAKGIVLNGENALSIGSEEQYKRAAEMTFNYNFAGFTLLRFYDVINNSTRMSQFNQHLNIKPVAQTMVVKNAPTSSGESVYIVGDRPELGQWDTIAYPIKLSYNSTYGDWRGTVNFPADRSVQFKAIIKRSDGSLKSWQPTQQYWNVPGTPTTYTNNW